MNRHFFLHVKVIGNYVIYHGDYKISVPDHVDPYDAIYAVRTLINLVDIFNVSYEISPHIVVDQRNINVFVNIMNEDPDFDELEKTILAFTHYLKFFFQYYFDPSRWDNTKDNEDKRFPYMARLGVYTAKPDGNVQLVNDFISLPIFSIAKKSQEEIDPTEPIVIGYKDIDILRKYVEKGILRDYLVDKISTQQVMVKLDEDDGIPTIKVIFSPATYSSFKENIDNSVMDITKHMISKEWREYKKVFEKNHPEIPSVLTIDYHMLS